MSKPILLHYYLTNRCNAKCTFCSIWHENPKADAQAKQVFENLKHAREAGCKFVDFTGGEPLLHRGLPDFLTEAKNLGYFTSVTTNCLLFAQQADNLSGKIDFLHFSLDADTAALHDSIRGVSSFSAVMESIPIALKNRMVPDLLFTYTDDNIDAVEGVFRIARANKLVLILDPVFNTHGKDPLKAKTHQKALEWAKKPGVYLNKAHLLLRSQGGNHIRSPLCKSVSSALVILPDNRLALPCYHHRCKEIPISGGLNSLLHSKEHLEAQAMEGKHSFCEGCHINCYFDPSYQQMRNSMFLASTKAKLSYTFDKYIRYGHKPPHWIW